MSFAQIHGLIKLESVVLLVMYTRSTFNVEPTLKALPLSPYLAIQRDLTVFRAILRNLAATVVFPFGLPLQRNSAKRGFVRYLRSNHFDLRGSAMAPAWSCDALLTDGLR